MSKVIENLQKILDGIENLALPIGYYIAAFISLFAVRRFLEFFSDSTLLTFKLLSPIHFQFYTIFAISFLHIFHHFLYWTIVTLMIAIVLSIFSREPIAKTLRTAFFFFFIVNCTPILDLIVSGGKGLNIHYPYPKHFFDFFPIPKDITIGMKVTLTTALLLCPLYTFIKTKRVILGIFTFIGVYLWLGFTGAIPLLLRQPTPLPTMRIMMLFFILELLIISFQYNKNYFLALLKDIRFLRILHYELILIWGISFSPMGLKAICWDWISFICITLSGILSWLGIIILNNIADTVIDKVSNVNRPHITTTIPYPTYHKIAFYISTTALICALMVNFATFFMILLILSIATLYSLPPFRLKRVPILSKILLAAANLIVIIIGYIFAQGELLSFPRHVIWYCLIFIGLCLNFIDLKDIAGDNAANIKTLPVLLGFKRAKLLIGSFFFICYTISGLVFLDLRLLFAGLAMGALQFYFFSRNEYKEKPILITHLVSLISLILFLSLKK